MSDDQSIVLPQEGVLDVRIHQSSCPPGYTDTGVNVDRGCNEDLRVCVKKGVGTAGVTDMTVLGYNTCWGGGLAPAAFTYANGENHPEGVDLNKNCGSKTEDVFTCIRMGPPPFLQDLTVIDGFGSLPGYEKINYNLKDGTGRNIFYWMKRGPSKVDNCAADPENLQYQDCKDLCLATPGLCDANVVKYCENHPEDTEFCGCYNTQEFESLRRTLSEAGVAFQPRCNATQCADHTAYKDVATANQTCSQQLCIQNLKLDVDSSQLKNVSMTCSLRDGAGTVADSGSGTSPWVFSSVSLSSCCCLIVILMLVVGGYFALQ